MFTPPGLAVFLILIKLVFGSLFGLVVVRVFYRSRFRVELAVRGAAAAGVVFLFVSGIAGWAGSHAVFQNGRRLDVAPWREDLQLRNFIVEHELLLCFVASSGAALLAGIRFVRTPTRANPN